MQADWSDLALGVSRVGGSGDAHQILLDILGLHPDSAEYYWRYSQSLTELYNVINLWGLGPQFWNALVELGLQASGTALLARLGDPNPNPDLLQHAFFTESGLVQTVVDDRPSSETDPVRAYTDDGRNYLQWLADTASASLDDVVAERGFTGDVSPRALLYLYLRHAVLLGYYDTSYHLHRTAGFLTPVQLAAMKPEAPFIHVDTSAGASESRYAALYKVEPRITTSSTQLVSDYIASNLAGLSEAADLADEIAALRQLADASTAELERLFAEHVDTCTYRLDAWLLGLPSFQLEQMRASAPAAAARRAGGGTGCYLGAYAWVEDLRPSGSVLEAAQPPEDVAADFAGDVPLVHDSANGGYIHAPSLPHARSAAVLRSGYLANASTANPDTLAVNLSSDRVRLALATLEGMRNGQSIGALLGYRFERGLHDSSGLAEVDKFIYPLRKAFPLVADSLASTANPAGRADRGDRGEQRAGWAQAHRPHRVDRRQHLPVRPGRPAAGQRARGGRDQRAGAGDARCQRRHRRRGAGRGRAPSRPGQLRPGGGHAGRLRRRLLPAGPRGRPDAGAWDRADAPGGRPSPARADRARGRRPTGGRGAVPRDAGSATCSLPRPRSAPRSPGPTRWTA